MVKNKLITIAVIGALATGFLVAFFLFPQIVKEEVKAKLPRLALPVNAAPTSPCFDKHGWHYATPEGIAQRQEINPSFVGPNYLVWQPTGEVLGVEYMVSEEYLKAFKPRIPADIGHNYLLQIGEEKGLVYEFANISFSLTHAGYEIPHYDLHYYLISPEKLDQLACPKK